jgi:hypothetical protein
MQYLGGMIAGNPVKGYQEARIRGQQVDAGNADLEGREAIGKWIQSIGAPGPPSATPMPTVSPGAPSMPTGGPPGGMSPSGMGGPPPGMGGSPGMGMPPGGPGGPPGAMPPRPPMGGPPGGGPPMGGPPPSPGIPPGGGGPPGMGGAPPTFGQPSGGLTFQQAMEGLVRANPGINPKALASAVIQLTPIMNAQTRQELQAMNMQLRAAGFDLREEIARMYEQGRTDRSRAGIESREGIAGRAEEGRERRSERTEGGREGRFERTEAGRESRFGRTEAGRESRFERREARLQSKADFDREFRTKSLQLAEDRFANTKTKQERDAAYKEEKAKLDAHYNELKARISAVAGGATGDKQTKELEAAYREAVKNLESSFMGKKTNRDMKTGAGIPVPSEYEKDPDGTKYDVDGRKHIKRGGMLVPE